MPGYIHHVEWCVSDLQTQVQVLVSHYGFEPIAKRVRKIDEKWLAEQILVQSGATVFLLTQKSRLTKTSTVQAVQANEYPVLVCCDQDHIRDTVFNVCLVVGQYVNEITAKIEAFEPSSVLVHPNDKCTGLLSVVKSCCGNIIHTLLEKKFKILPGFEEIGDKSAFGKSWNDNCLRTTHMDHVTYVCHQGQSQKILQWYHKMFKMRRFFVNPQVNSKIKIPREIATWKVCLQFLNFGGKTQTLEF